LTDEEKERYKRLAENSSTEANKTLAENTAIPNPGEKRDRGPELVEETNDSPEKKFKPEAQAESADN
jgi:hypothetical protein